LSILARVFLLPDEFLARNGRTCGGPGQSA
jgi:hypothetical protein